MKPFYRIKKVYVTLLETLIAITILSVLLVFVFGLFREMNVMTQLTDQNQKESFQNRYLESRLNYIFERITNENSGAITPFYFYTEQPRRNQWETTSLVITFDNGVRPDPQFSGPVLAKLYVDPDKTFRLAIWPLDVEDPHTSMHEEILLEKVDDLNFSFYRAPERMQAEKEIHTGKVIDTENKLPEKDKWHDNDWPITYEQMPSIIKISVKIKGDPKTHDFHFVLPSSKNPVQYPPPKGGVL